MLAVKRGEKQAVDEKDFCICIYFRDCAVPHDVNIFDKFSGRNKLAYRDNRGFSSTWDNDESEWFINIGGHVGHDKVTGGIQIPVFFYCNLWDSRGLP